jgi:probable rRNA maturation factor
VRIAPSAARGDVAIALVSDRRIQALNRAYRGKDYATDVLSFPVEADERQARHAGHSLQTELRVLALHGLLHLLGYDHDDPGDSGRMARVEARLRRKGGLSRGLIERNVSSATGQ